MPNTPLALVPSAQDALENEVNIAAPPIYVTQPALPPLHEFIRSFETSRDFCFIANVVQANLLAATAQSADAVNQVYNVAVGERTCLNELYAQLHRNLLPHYPQLEGAQPVHRDFRAGDVRHSLADIAKAQRLLGYAPTQRIGEGLALAMPWYMAQET